MNLVPEWAPNVHPLIVHFPIALLFAAALVDVVSLGIRLRYPTVRHAAVGLYVLGAMAAVVTFFTGRSASDGVDLPVTAVSAVNAHADWALWTVWVFGLYALVRLGVAFWKRSGDLAVHLPLALVGVAALFLVQQTAERGAKLVFLYGVGVQAVDIENPTRHDHDAHGMGADEHDETGADEHAEGEHMVEDAVGAPSAAPLTTDASGAWAWTDDRGALPADLDILSGAPASGATLTAAPGRPALVALGTAVGDLEAEATLDLSGFTGTAMLVHHLRDAQTYDFLAIDKPASGVATVRQGRVTGGTETTFDSGTASLPSPVALKTYAVGTHFRGYVGGDQVTHGHGDAAPPGRVGLRLDGTGPVRVLTLSATPAE